MYFENEHLTMENIFFILVFKGIYIITPNLHYLFYCTSLRGGKLADLKVETDRRKA